MPDALIYPGMREILHLEADRAALIQWRRVAEFHALPEGRACAEIQVGLIEAMIGDREARLLRMERRGEVGSA